MSEPTDRTDARPGDRQIRSQPRGVVNYFLPSSAMPTPAQGTEPPKGGTLTLSDGADAPFRAIRPEDAAALQRFHARCSERAIYLRCFGSLEEPPDE